MDSRLAPRADAVTDTLVVDHVSKRFGNHLVLNDVQLTVAEGELVSIVGPSGGGKTTLLRIVAGLIEPTQGRIGLRGEDVTRVPASRRNIGVVFQNYALFPHMTGWENIAYPLRLRRWSADEIRRRVEELVQVVQVRDVRRYPHSMSGGEQQRVALARALAANPSMLLLDEPFSALDYRVRVDIRAEFKRLHGSLGVTMLLVTHDQEEALSMADRVVVLSPTGSVEQVGSPEDVYMRPATRFVATFIGSVNALPVSAYDPRHGTFDWAGRRWRSRGAAVREWEGGAMALVRPEDVVIDPAGLLQGEVVEHYFYGSYYRTVIRLEETTLVADVPRQVGVGLGVGSRVSLRLPLAPWPEEGGDDA
jgi:putative spermidine/putrescine transport system ATP-binding protein